MSDEEFLARWSRRKHEARSVVDAPPPEQAEALNSALSATAAHPEDAEVDLSSLPPIESITGATDITAFLPLARPVWDEFSAVVGKELLDRIVALRQ